MTEAELNAGLAAMKTQVGKIAKEQSDRFDVLSKEIADLQAIIDAGGAITPATVAAMADVQSALDELDAAIPDAPVV